MSEQAENTNDSADGNMGKTSGLDEAERGDTNERITNVQEETTHMSSVADTNERTKCFVYNTIIAYQFINYLQFNIKHVLF